MRCLLPCFFVAALGLAVVSCGGYVGDHPTGTGPFDSRGNYIESWADNPSKWNGRSVPKPKAKKQEKKSEQAPPQVVQRDPAPVRKTTPPPAKPKPKPKPKPRTTYHTVRKGDTLYGLSKRYGTTVGKIQKANGISGSVIRIGQKLKIPR